MALGLAVTQQRHPGCHYLTTPVPFYLPHPPQESDDDLIRPEPSNRYRGDEGCSVHTSQTSGPTLMTARGACNVPEPYYGLEYTRPIILPGRLSSLVERKRKKKKKERAFPPTKLFKRRLLSME